MTAATKRRRPRGAQKAPTKESISVRLDAVILRYYRGGGPGWQTRMNDDLLRLVARRQKGGQ